MNLQGSLVALVTPMDEQGAIDKAALSHLIDWHLEANTQGFIIAGTTGECATLNADEQFDLVSTVVRQVAGRVPVIAGTGTNCTHSTIKLSENAKRAGADGCLIVTPYYNKPTQNGLYAHYKAVADKIDLPIILYNVPSRCACDLLPETVERLSQLKTIVGIKEATGKIERTQEIKQRCHDRFAVFSGDDATALKLMIDGGAQGVISVTANVAPEKMQALCQAALKGDVATAEKLDKELSLLHQRLFIESNPTPTKWVLQQMGKIKSGIRLPLLPLDRRYHDEVKNAMQQAGV